MACECQPVSNVTSPVVPESNTEHTLATGCWPQTGSPSPYLQKRKLRPLLSKVTFKTERGKSSSLPRLGLAFPFAPVLPATSLALPQKGRARLTLLSTCGLISRFEERLFLRWLKSKEIAITYSRFSIFLAFKTQPLKHKRREMVWKNNQLAWNNWHFSPQKKRKYCFRKLSAAMSC